MDINKMETRDMHVAAILVAYGSPVTHVDRTDPKRQIFYFDRLPPEVFVRGEGEAPIPYRVSCLGEIVSLFLSKRLYFPPSFVDCIRSVKAYIYAE